MVNVRHFRLYKEPCLYIDETDPVKRENLTLQARERHNAGVIFFNNQEE